MADTIFGIIVVIWLYSCASKDIKLEESFNTLDTRDPNYYFLYFFISNYKGYLKSQTFADSLICSSLPGIQTKYRKFSIHVFKYTKLANASRLSKRPMLVDEGNWLTGDELARNDLIQKLEYSPRSGYHLFDYNLLFTCDTTYHKNR